MTKKRINNREHQRFNISKKLWAKINKTESDSFDFKLYRIIDISQGGMAILSNSETEFKRNDDVVVMEIEGRDLLSPLMGKVRYVQYLDDDGYEFKVGIEFLAKVK